ncbi:MAG TPA: hypothetical protein VKD22_02530 [Ramlibacter sp.]|nr:hypothetical protein [Ramlibacter sp.]
MTEIKKEIVACVLANYGERNGDSGLERPDKTGGVVNESPILARTLGAPRLQGFGEPLSSGDAHG